MPRDLFASSEPRTVARSRRSSLLLASIAFHGVALATILLVSILVPDVLPKPHAADLEWDPTTRVVKLADVPLPPPTSVKPPTTPGEPHTSLAAPLEAPIGIAPEVSLPQPPPLPGFLDGTTPALEPVKIAPPPAPTAPELPAGPVRMHAGIDAPRKIRDVAPEYPVLARSTGAHGVVVIEATIDVDGNVVETRVLRSVSLLDAAAVDAVRHWKYTPARLNGAPVSVLVTVTVNFVLGEQR